MVHGGFGSCSGVNEGIIPAFAWRVLRIITKIYVQETKYDNIVVNGTGFLLGTIETVTSVPACLAMDSVICLFYGL
jgi:hypothetical protein